MKAKRLLFALVAVVFAALIALLAASSVSARAATGSAEETDNALADTYQLETGFVNAPTVIAELGKGCTLTSIPTEGARPSNVIIRFNEHTEAVDRDGNVLDSFTDVYRGLKNKVLPVIYLESEDEAAEFIHFTANKLKIADAAVMSPVPEAVKAVKSEFPHFRGMIDFTASDLKYLDDGDVVRTLNLNYATVAVLPQSYATRERVTFIQARFKTVWVRADSTEDVSILGCVASGAYGIVTDDFKAVQSCIAAMDEKAYSRPIFNVAHRGVPNSYNENSLSGTKAAIACGATHVELDGKITTDGEILMMHDDDISRTATGNGNIENMTFEQARTHLLDLHEPKDELIPTVGEIMKELKGTGVILVFEIKTSKQAIIQPLREAIEENDFWDQIVVIAFDTAQLERMKVIIPEVPTANLNSPPTGAGFLGYASSMGELNTGVDCSSKSVELNEKYLKDRGIIGWYWTMSDLSAIESAIDSGYVGVTNNAADSCKDIVKSVDFADALKAGGEYGEGDGVALTVTTYGGAKSQVTGEIYKAFDFGNRKEIIALYRADGVTYFTETYRLYAPDAPIGLIVGCCVAGAAVIGGSVAVAVILIKKRKGNEK